jgi:hypothetical protein
MNSILSYLTFTIPSSFIKQQYFLSLSFFFFLSLSFLFPLRLYFWWLELSACSSTGGGAAVLTAELEVAETLRELPVPPQSSPRWLLPMTCSTSTTVRILPRKTRRRESSTSRFPLVPATTVRIRICLCLLPMTCSSREGSYRLSLPRSSELVSLPRSPHRILALGSDFLK